jgi:hypothetical protein
MQHFPQNVVTGIILIVSGLILIIFHRRLGQYYSDHTYKHAKIRFSVKFFQMVELILGIAFIIWGLQRLSNIRVGEDIVTIIEFVGIVLSCGLIGGVVLRYHEHLGRVTSDSFFEHFRIRLNVLGCQIAHLILGIIIILFGLLLGFKII